MKKTLTSLSSFLALIGILLTLFVTSVSAQSISASTMDMVPVGDLSHDAIWKTPVDYSQVIAAERVSTAQLLATPNLKDAKIALYQGYDRMLVYIQTDLAADLPLTEIAAKSFGRVNQEASSDPVLKDMPVDEFSDLYQALIGKLSD